MREISGYLRVLSRLRVLFRCPRVSLQRSGPCRQLVNYMSPPQDPEDEQGGGDPPGDLRSVLVTSVLNLEPLDEDLFR